MVLEVYSTRFRIKPLMCSMLPSPIITMYISGIGLLLLLTRLDETLFRKFMEHRNTAIWWNITLQYWDQFPYGHCASTCVLTHHNLQNDDWKHEYHQKRYISDQKGTCRTYINFDWLIHQHTIFGISNILYRILHCISPPHNHTSKNRTSSTNQSIEFNIPAATYTNFDWLIWLIWRSCNAVRSLHCTSHHGRRQHTTNWISQWCGMRSHGGKRMLKTSTTTSYWEAYYLYS